MTSLILYTAQFIYPNNYEVCTVIFRYIQDKDNPYVTALLKKDFSVSDGLEIQKFLTKVGGSHL